MGLQIPQLFKKTPNPPPEPIITPEADKAIFRVMVRYGMIAFGLVVLLPLAYGIIYSLNPHSKIFNLQGPVAYLMSAVWIIPFYIGATKTSDMRIQYGRQYLEERRWKEVAAALRTFTEWGQRSFDRTGEAHYMLSVALDKLGRKEKAEEARKFVRKHRAGTEWAVKSGGDPLPGKSAGERGVPSASQLRRKAVNSDIADETTVVGKRTKALPPAGAAPRARRRRF